MLKNQSILKLKTKNTKHKSTYLKVLVKKYIIVQKHTII